MSNFNIKKKKKFIFFFFFFMKFDSKFRSKNYQKVYLIFWISKVKKKSSQSLKLISSISVYLFIDIKKRIN